MGKGSGETCTRQPLLLDATIAGDSSARGIEQILSEFAAASHSSEPIQRNIPVLIREAQTRKTRAGKDFDVVTIADASGDLEVRDFQQTLKTLEYPQYATIGLRVEAYNGSASGIIRSATALKAGEVDESKFCAFDQAANRVHREQAQAAIESVPAASPCRNILEAVFDNETFQRFSDWPAATRHHHAYRGGLIEHTLEVMHYSRGFAKLDSEVYDPHLLTTAALIHDIGKLDEYNGPPRLGKSTGGEFAYHLAYGQLRLGMAIKQCAIDGTPVPQSVVYRLAHCIEMSHGHHRLDQQRTFIGKEARLISVADDYSAKLTPTERETKSLEAVYAAPAQVDYI